MSLTILDQTTERDEAFFQLEEQIYFNDPWYLPIERQAQEESLRRSRFAGQQLALLITRDGIPVARAVARFSSELHDEEHAPVGMIGFFEAANDSEAVDRLFDQLTDFLRSNGCKKIVGPMDGDTWHRYRLNVGPFKQPMFHLEPYNPRYYESLWLDYGFKPFEEYVSTRLIDLPLVLEKLEEDYTKASATGYTFRQFDKNQFEQELDLIHELTVKIFKKNLLYSEISREEFGALYKNARKLIVPSLVWFAHDPEGVPSGFIFAFPDYLQAVRAASRPGFLPKKLRFFLKARLADTVNMKTLGVVDSARGTGTAGALMYLAHYHAQRLGYPNINHCLIRKGNPSSRFSYRHGSLLRKYRLYEL